MDERKLAFLRHPAEYQFWRTAQRSITATSKQFKRAKKTIEKHRDGEDWIARADAEDAALGQKIATEHETELARHLREMSTLLKLGRAALYKTAEDIILRYQQNSNVDTGEVRDLIASLQSLERAGANRYGLDKLPQVPEKESDTEAIRKRLLSVLEGKPPQAQA